MGIWFSCEYLQSLLQLIFLWQTENTSFSAVLRTPEITFSVIIYCLTSSVYFIQDAITFCREDENSFFCIVFNQYSVFETLGSQDRFKFLMDHQDEAMIICIAKYSFLFTVKKWNHTVKRGSYKKTHCASGDSGDNY